MTEEFTKKWVGGVCVRDREVLLIHRINKKNLFNSEYFVLPGSLNDEDLSDEEVLLQEFKELGAHIAVEKILLEKEDEDDPEYYYLCHIEQGEPNLETVEWEEEGYAQHKTPVWVDISNLDDLILYPEEIKERLTELFMNEDSY